MLRNQLALHNELLSANGKGPARHEPGHADRHRYADENRKIMEAVARHIVAVAEELTNDVALEGVRPSSNLDPRSTAITPAAAPR